MTWHALEVDGAVGTAPVVARVVDDPERTVLLLRDADGTLHATATGCPHLGSPLSMGHVDGEVLECDHHAYQYRLTDGVCVSPGGPLAGVLAIHDVRERGGVVEVRFVEAAPA